jgi:hypothetical protein
MGRMRQPRVSTRGADLAPKDHVSGGPREDVGWARDPMLREAALSGRDDRLSQDALTHPAAMLPAFQGRSRIGAAAGARGIGIRTDPATDAEQRDAGASEVAGSVAAWVEELLGRAHLGSRV